MATTAQFVWQSLNVFAYAAQSARAQSRCGACVCVSVRCLFNYINHGVSVMSAAEISRTCGFGCWIQAERRWHPLKRFGALLTLMVGCDSNQPSDITHTFGEAVL